MVRAPARERLDDIADPVRKLGQDLVRFVSRCRCVHTRLAALAIHVNQCPSIIDFIFTLANGKPSSPAQS